MTSRTWATETRWMAESDVSAWVAGSRLNLLRGLPERAAEPPVREAIGRFVSKVVDATERLRQL